MSDQDPKAPKEKRDWDRTVGKIMKTIGIVLAMLCLVLVLIVGLVLGACFLGSRR